MRIAERSLLLSSLQQAIPTMLQLVCDQTGEELDRRHRFGLVWMQTSF